MLTFCEQTMHAMCGQLAAEPVEFNGEADHVRLLAAYPPTVAASTLVPRLTGRTAYPVRREFTGACARARLGGRRRSAYNFAVSCRGGPLSIIKQHIDGQARPL